MTLEKFAKIISRIFDFYVLAPILLIITIVNTGLSTTQIKTLTPLLVLVDLIFPMTLFLILLRKRRIADIDITKRQERHLFFGFTTIILLISTLFVYFLGNYRSFVLSIAFLFIMLTVFLTTLKWKISGHLTINCIAIFIINYLFDWKFLWLFSLVPLVAFARLYLKKHSTPQVLAGIIVGIVEPYVILKILHLI